MDAIMIKSLNYWSWPGGLENTLCPFDFLRGASANGFSAVELAIGEGGNLCLESNENYCRELRDAAHREGLAIPSTASGLYWSRALGDSIETSRIQALDDLKRMLQISAWLGAKTHLTIPGAVDVFFLPERPAGNYADTRRHALLGLKEAAKTAESLNVRIAIENVWNKFLLSPTEMLGFIRDVGSTHVGAYVDVGNVLLYGYPQDWLRVLGDKVFGVHLKDFRKAVGTAAGFVDLLEGDVDWPEVLSALREIGYGGPLVAEMIPGYRFCPEIRIANTSRAMDAILAL
jgi:hexulose-6-phosphate isomerase